MPIVQNDLPELEATNQNVLEMLWSKENDAYQGLRSNISGLDILKKLADCGIPVLLDADAVILELSNEQVAREWLKLVSSELYDAAIYFSDKDILLTIDRKDSIVEFEYSVYHGRLERCIHAARICDFPNIHERVYPEKIAVEINHNRQHRFSR